MTYKEQEINNLIINITKKLNNFPPSLIAEIKKRYQNDERSFTTISQEITTYGNKIIWAEQMINKPLNTEVLNNSFLLIGPMGVGKTTIAKELSNLTNMPLISLDNREALAKYYQEQKSFSNFKEFEFYLTTSVLTSLTKPSIIDFGAGHSIYENPLLFYEMQQLLKRFQNIDLIMPSTNKEEALKIANTRLQSRPNIKSFTLLDNRHFIESPCNYKLATKTIYTNTLSPQQVASTILKESSSNTKKR